MDLQQELRRAHAQRDELLARQLNQDNLEWQLGNQHALEVSKLREQRTLGWTLFALMALVNLGYVAHYQWGWF